MAKQTYSILIGALSPDIDKQLAEQGLLLPDGRAAVWDRRCRGLLELVVAGVVTDAEKDRIGQRIAQMIGGEARKITNKEAV